MRITATLAIAALAAPGLYCQTDWPAYGHDPTGQRYSPLTQISTKNVAKLKRAWQYGVDPAGNDLNSANRALAGTEAVPIMAGGLLYTPTAKHTVVALEPETGKEIWKYELNRVGAPLRGVTYWQGDKDIPAEILLGNERRPPHRAQRENRQARARLRQRRHRQPAHRRRRKISRRARII